MSLNTNGPVQIAETIKGHLWSNNGLGRAYVVATRRGDGWDVSIHDKSKTLPSVRIKTFQDVIDLSSSLGQFKYTWT